MVAPLIIAAIVLAVVSTAYSVYAASKAVPPDEATGVARKLSTSSDAESPWDIVYGHEVKGAHVPWAGVAGGDQEKTGVDYILASHPIEAVISVQVGRYYFEITTDPDATEGLILNADRAPHDTEYPDTWYVPVKASAWYRKDQTKNTSDKISHIGIKFNLGDQTTTDSHMASVFGAKYTDAGARKFIGHSVAHVIFRAHDELDTLGGVPSMKWEVLGKNDLVLSNDGATTGYSNATAAVLADLMVQFGSIDDATDVVSHMPGEAIEELIDECEMTAWDPLGTAARYTFNGTIRWDEEPTEAYEKVARHMMGGFSERGSKVVFWTGTARSVALALTEADFAGGGSGRTDPVQDDDWVNTYIPHRKVLTALDEDGNTALHGEIEPVKKATTASYVTEDGGEVLVQDIFFEGCILSRRARDWAHIALDTVRLGDRYTRTYRKRAILLEVGDVYSTTDPTRFASATKFRCTHKSAPDHDWNVDITGVRYQDALYDQRSVTEDAIGVLKRGRSAFVPILTGLDISVLEGSAQVQADGSITVDILATWDAITEVQLRAGVVKVSWKKAANDWPGHNSSSSADEIALVLPGLKLLQAYTFRARIEGAAGTAGRAGIPRGDWTADVSFTPGTGTSLNLKGVAATLNLSENRHNNPNFNQGPMPGGTDPIGWEFETAASGSTTWVDTVGRFGLGYASVAMVLNTRRIRQTALMPVIPGERHLSRYWMKLTAAISNWKGLINILYYEDDETFISTTTIASIEFSSSGWIRLRKAWTVPTDDDIRYARFQVAIQLPASPTGNFTVLVDGTKTARVFGGRSSLLTTAQTVNNTGGADGTVWTNMRRITAGTPGDPVALAGKFYARVGDEGLSNPVQLEVRAVRWDADGTSNLTVLDIAGGSTALQGEEYVEGTAGADNWYPWAYVSVVAFDTTEAQGEFVYAFQFRATRVNGKASVKYRFMEWKVEDETGTT